MNRTLIPWVKNPDGSQGFTWNPITGCLNHVNGMCKGGNFPCYAYRLATTRLYHVYMADKNSDRFETVEPHSPLNMPEPFVPRFWEDRLPDPLRTKGGSPKGIFTCDMSDLFGIGIPEGWTRRVLGTIRLCPQHRFYLLTKQPQNLIKFSPFPDNCYVGITACDASDAVRANEYMALIQAKVKFLSIEPMQDWNLFSRTIEGIISYYNWLILGSQTKPLKHPPFEYVEEKVNAADRAGIPVFIKPPLCDVMNYHRQDMPVV